MEGPGNGRLRGRAVSPPRARHRPRPLKRYVEGARQRGETGLVIACIGAGKHSYNVFSGSVAPGIHLPGHHGQISANPLPAGVSPELTDGLDHAEHDLATRLLNHPPRTPGSA